MMGHSELPRDAILVLAELENGRCAPITLELLKAGADLSGDGGNPFCACVFGHNVGGLADEISWYAGRVYVIDNPLLARFQSDIYASALEALCRALDPRVVLMGHTYDNLELAPKLAYRMQTDLITDCIKVERDGKSGGLLCTKPIYGGNAVAVLQVDARPQIATMRPKAVNAMEKGACRGETTAFACELASSLALTESLGLVLGETVSLDKADVIVSGGRGVKSAEGVADLKRLVAALGKHFDTVELGASRSLVDAGLLPHSRQIGQTGEKVSPRVYVAVAISGAAQHMAGVVGAGKVIAINKDTEAPIFGASDYGVVGQYEEIVPALVKRLEELG